MSTSQDTLRLAVSILTDLIQELDGEGKRDESMMAGQALSALNDLMRLRISQQLEKAQ